ncbi:hypothetical protein CC80DRAFT_551900 [Byssothecium circinans]|uniref:Uncharacterized protein n=1 Tax=Byssothecium circinans TaxID=147558 RepID=A0A6A5TJJ4_9PLEO|nr:hypothetical protein CC80DRAFT_551900 [Byssothecium circinans]
MAQDGENLGTAEMERRPHLFDLPNNVLRMILRHAGLLRSCPTSLLKEHSRIRQLRELGSHNSTCGKRPFTSMTRWLQDIEYHHYDNEIRNSHGLLQSCGMECLLRHGRFFSHQGLDNWPCKLEELVLQTSSATSSLPFCEHPPFPLGLLLACKRMNVEGTAILYGENTLCVNTWQTKIMDYFLQLRASTLSTMRTLHVFYAPTYGPTNLEKKEKKDMQDSCTGWRVPGYQARWARFCSVINENRLSSLTLTLESFPANSYTARKILRPLRDVQVKHLRLDLGPHARGRSLTKRLRKTIRTCTDGKSASGEVDLEHSFPFERLPNELQQHVLSFTGLVITPNALCHDRLDILGINITDKPRPLINGCCGACNTENFAHCLCHGNYNFAISTTCIWQPTFSTPRTNSTSLEYQKTMLEYVENIPLNNLRLMQNFCIDLDFPESGGIGIPRYARRTDVSDWNMHKLSKSRHRHTIQRIINLLQRHAYPNLSIKITSRNHLLLGLVTWDRPHTPRIQHHSYDDVLELRHFCDWIQSCGFERVSVMVRFSRARGGDVFRDWSTLFVLMKDSEDCWGAVADDGENYERVEDRIPRWYPWGKEWGNVILGAISGPQVPLLS